MDKTAPFPTDWNEWRATWDEYRAELNGRYGVTRGAPAGTFPGKNMLADEILGTWTIGQPGSVHPVELSEVTMPAFGDRRGGLVRYVGVTIDGVGLAGRSELAATFAELDDILAALVHDRTMP